MIKAAIILLYLLASFCAFGQGADTREGGPNKVLGFVAWFILTLIILILLGAL